MLFLNMKYNLRLILNIYIYNKYIEQSYKYINFFYNIKYNQRSILNLYIYNVYISKFYI